MRKKLKRMQEMTQHNLNVCHLYCRLVEMGVNRKRAACLCRFLERTTLYKLLYIRKTIH